jgi:hypothetical protein
LTGRRLPSPARAQFLTDLSPAMARALVRCGALPVLIKDPRSSGIAKQTIEALVRHGLVEEKRDRRARPVWRPSTAGAAIVAASRPRLLAAQSQYGYTTDPADALPDEPEAIGFGDQGSLRRSDTAHAAELELLADRREIRGLEDELRQLRRIAEKRGVDIRNDVRVIEKRVDKIRERILDQHAGRRRVELDEAMTELGDVRRGELDEQDAA